MSLCLFSRSSEYQKTKNDNKISYVWDGIIERLYSDFESNFLINSVSWHEMELALRLMNKETRFGRGQLSKMLMEVLGNGRDKPKVRARIVFSELESSPLYVVMARPDSDRDFSRKELHMRCLVARSLYPKNIVIGIGTDPYEKKKGHSLDLVYMDFTDWNQVNQDEAEKIKNELGYFKSPITTRLKSNG